MSIEKIERFKNYIATSDCPTEVFMAKNRSTKEHEIVLKVGNHYIVGSQMFLYKTQYFEMQYILVSELGRLREEGE